MPNTKHRKRSPQPRSPEYRFFKSESLEVRSTSGDSDIVLAGTPIVYDTPYTVVDLEGEFREVIAAGAVTDLLASQPDVLFCFNHDTSALPLARTSSGTLSLRDTAAGLTFEARLDPNNSHARDVASAVSRGDVSQMSVGFYVAPGGERWSGINERQITKLGGLIDVSAVTHPASPTTHIEIAQRMLMAMPIQSRARLDKLYAEIRSGKTLNSDNAAMITNAAQTLHDVLASGGVDFAHGIDLADPVEDEEPEVVAMSDGTDGDIEAAETGSDFDEMRSDALALELELMELEHRAAGLRAA
jgi:uncharacterized protein